MRRRPLPFHILRGGRGRAFVAQRRELRNRTPQGGKIEKEKGVTHAHEDAKPPLCLPFDWRMRERLLLRGREAEAV